MTEATWSLMHFIPCKGFCPIRPQKSFVKQVGHTQDNFKPNFRPEIILECGICTIISLCWIELEPPRSPNLIRLPPVKHLQYVHLKEYTFYNQLTLSLYLVSRIVKIGQDLKIIQCVANLTVLLEYVAHAAETMSGYQPMTSRDKVQYQGSTGNG